MRIAHISAYMCACRWRGAYRREPRTTAACRAASPLKSAEFNVSSVKLRNGFLPAIEETASRSDSTVLHFTLYVLHFTYSVGRPSSNVARHSNLRFPASPVTRKPPKAAHENAHAGSASRLTSPTRRFARASQKSKASVCPQSDNLLRICAKNKASFRVISRPAQAGFRDAGI